MGNNNRLTRGEASVGSLVVDDIVRFNDTTEQDTAYHQHNLSAFSTATQTNTGGGTAPVAMRFETISAANQISIVNNTRITPSHSSEYNIQFSAQVDKTDGGKDEIDIWFAINGTAIPYSNTRLTLPSNADDKVVASWNFITPLQDTEYLEIYWYSSDTAMRLYAEGPQTNPTRPGIPSVILTAWEI
jgi:hypothetical protein